MTISSAPSIRKQRCPAGRGAHRPHITCNMHGTVLKFSRSKQGLKDSLPTQKLCKTYHLGGHIPTRPMTKLAAIELVGYSGCSIDELGKIRIEWIDNHCIKRCALQTLGSFGISFLISNNKKTKIPETSILAPQRQISIPI